MAPNSRGPHSHGNLTISLIPTVVGQEIANMNIPSAGSPRLTMTAPIIASATPRQYSANQYQTCLEWRSPNDRPICFVCFRIGHISCHYHSRCNLSPQLYMTVLINAQLILCRHTPNRPTLTLPLLLGSSLAVRPLRSVDSPVHLDLGNLCPHPTQGNSRETNQCSPKR